MKPPRKRDEVLEAVAARGGLVSPEVLAEVHAETGVPEAEVHGTASFYSVLANPEVKVRVCQGLSCALRGSEELLEAAKRAGHPAGPCSCLAACDRAPAVMVERRLVPTLSVEDVESASDWRELGGESGLFLGEIGGSEELAMDLAAKPDGSAQALGRTREMGPDWVLEQLEASGLQGRGGAGFPAAFKWRSVRSQAESTRYVVLNADEGEPGTFKDRELLMRRPDLVAEGLAVAAELIGAAEIYCYVREAFEELGRRLQAAFEPLVAAGFSVPVHVHRGHGAYICGEETALLEALEGKRGLPRNKPPFPTERGLWGKPTLIHNVETIACVPAIVRRGGEWFKALGRTGPGTKLYCVSGDVERPGVYELPLGVCLDELVEAAGGYVGTLKAFSPGGASSGFLPASEAKRPLDFKSLAEAGSRLGSAGVVVLNDQADLAAAVRTQLAFFEDESCGQCAPCRIGTRFLRVAVDRHRSGEGGSRPLSQVAEVAWEMNEGSICGLGQAASLPLTTTLRHFPEAFGK